MEVVLTESAAEDLEALTEPIHARVLRVLERLARWPDVSGARPLSRELAARARGRAKKKSRAPATGKRRRK